MKHQVLGFPAPAKKADSATASGLSVPALPSGTTLRVRKKSARRPRWKLRAFFTAFCCTLIVLGGFFGIARVDIATRHVGFADGRTFYVRVLRPGLQAHPGICKFADLWYNRLVEIVCPQALGD